MLYKTQLFRFIAIGGLAAGTNIVALCLIIEFFYLKPLIANSIAFLLAFQVSYWGHRLWTFNHKGHSYRSVIKFCLVAIIGFLATEYIFAFLLKALGWYYLPAITLALAIVAIGTFISSKLWAFQ